MKLEDGMAEDYFKLNYACVVVKMRQDTILLKSKESMSKVC